MRARRAFASGVGLTGQVSGLALTVGDKKSCFYNDLMWLGSRTKNRPDSSGKAGLTEAARVGNADSALLQNLCDYSAFLRRFAGFLSIVSNCLIFTAP